MIKKLPLVLALALCGCAFVQRHQTAVATLAGLAAQEGTKRRLAAHPEERPAFMAAQVALTRLVDQKNYDPAAFADALSKLPINELKGDTGSVYISAAVVVWDEIANEAEGVQKQEQVRLVATAVRDGIGRGLSAQL
jgi:hypothetical protein